MVFYRADMVIRISYLLILTWCPLSQHELPPSLGCTVSTKSIWWFSSPQRRLHSYNALPMHLFRSSDKVHQNPSSFLPLIHIFHAHRRIPCQGLPEPELLGLIDFTRKVCVASSSISRRILHLVSRAHETSGIVWGQPPCSVRIRLPMSSSPSGHSLDLQGRPRMICRFRWRMRKRSGR